MFPLLNQEAENPAELFQIWLNLPKKNKLVEPEYKMFWSEEIPSFEAETGVNIEVLAGELLGRKSPTPPVNSWAADAGNFVGDYNIQMQANSTFLMPKTAEGINRTFYFYKGNQLNLEEKLIPNYHAIDVVSDEDLILKSGNENIKILVLQGRPINESVVQHGPFVMNTETEIRQAFNDYKNGKMGKITV